MPPSLHTASRRQGGIHGPPTRCCATLTAATKALYPSLSMCDLIFSGVFERHPRDAGHRRVRAGMGAPPALDDGLHLPRATAKRFTGSRACPREGGRLHAPERLLATMSCGASTRMPSAFAYLHPFPPLLRERERGLRQPDVGLGLSHSESRFPRIG
jgi:hypothetical protein